MKKMLINFSPGMNNFHEMRICQNNATMRKKLITFIDI